LGLINGLDNTFMPPVLLCVTLFVLVLENLVFVCSTSPWAVTASAGGEPVYTSIYCEWLVNVPILLVLAGNCALDRPSGEISRPLLVTNIYIVFAWTAHFIPSPFLR
ncbi:mask, partial [Symbiodinium sp. KB8]